MFWAPVCDGKSEARDFRGTGVCEIIAHLKRLWWFPPFPPDPKLNNWPANMSASVCEINAQSSKGPRLIFFNFGSGGGEGGNVLKNIKYKWAIILQTPVPGKSFSSGLVLQPRAQTTNSRVLFCFRFRAVAHNESVRRTLGTKRSLAPRVEFLGRAWSAPPSAGPSDKEKPSSAACVFR